MVQARKTPKSGSWEWVSLLSHSLGLSKETIMKVEMPVVIDTFTGKKMGKLSIEQGDVNSLRMILTWDGGAVPFKVYPKKLDRALNVFKEDTND